jgi:hypothetical protein
MLDDLRKSASQESSRFDDEIEEDVFAEEERAARRGDTRFLGMTAVERMLLSIFLFMNVLVLGLAILIATGRLQF